jgi:iron complex outermembrane receptor protein
LLQRDKKTTATRSLGEEQYMTMLANGDRRPSRLLTDPVSRLTAATAATLTALACLLGLGTTSAAFAQQATTASQGQATGGLEEIVVSAERREEKLQTTPIAITALSGEALESRNLANVTEVGAFVPTAVIQPLGAGWGATMAAFIRGVGLGDNILSFEPGVPIYVDDVYTGRPQGSIFDLLDLERVEVLRGPQGTLFGKNAEGGTVRLISVKPQGNDTGRASFTAGNLNRLDARAMADISLIPDRVFARFSFSSKRADGYFKNLDYVCVNGAGSLGSLKAAIAPGSNCVTSTQGNENVQSGRAAFRFLISDAAEFNLVGDVTHQDQEGPADKYTVIDGTNIFNSLWGPATYASAGTPTAGPPAYIGKPISYDSRFLTNSTYTGYGNYGTDPISGRNVPNINNLKHWGVAGTLEWKLADSLNLKSVTAYRKFDNQFGRDSDGSPLSQNSTYDDSRHHQFTEEITLTGAVSRLEWATGAFYYAANDSNRGYDVLYPNLPGNPCFFPCIHQQDSYVSQTTENWAVFAHGVVHITEPFSITGGARYTSDKKNATIWLINFNPTVPVVVGQYVPTSATHVDYDVSLNYQWTQDLMTYARYSTGFKGGGFSPRPADAVQTLPFKPEYLRTFELGAKSEFLNHRVRVNGDFFYSKYVDQQTFSQQCDPGTGGPGQPPCINWFREENAGTARLWGLEGELQAEPIDYFRIDASFGYVNYVLQDNGGNNLLFTGDHCGGETCYSPRTPKYTAAAGAQYSMPLAGGLLTPRLDMTYQSKIYFNAGNNGCFAANSTAGCGVTNDQGGYTLFNGRIGWETDSKKWNVALWGRNLTSKEYFSGKLSLIGFFGREQGNPAPPREYGVTVERKF